MRPILVAFSGGIDSCAAIELLRSQGFAPQAMTIDMVGDEELLEQARTSAERLGVELHVVDGRKLFTKEVIDNFINEYRSGRTPAPCTRCNPLIKWQLLANKADELGIYHIATGHYFRVEQHGENYYVVRGDDPHKDQSYYLWGLSQHILSRITTPMGDQIKEVVKSRSTIKKESMGICFLRGQHYSHYLQQVCGQSSGGEVINAQREVVGHHNGIYNYTIGQRRGEGIPSGKRVAELLPTTNQIRVEDNSELFTLSLDIEECNFVDRSEIENSDQITVMIRGIGLNPEGYAKVVIDDHTAHITLSSPAWAAAAGQPVVLYIGSRVVGGGYLR